MMTYHEHRPLEEVGGVHDALKQHGLQFLWIHLLTAEWDAIEEADRYRAQPTLPVELPASLPAHNIQVYAFIQS